jgi:2-deoxy-D-gluconate 3-dehydrogenase
MREFDMNDFSLKGKTAIVTGGAQGLCNGMAYAFHKAGAEVVLLDASEKVFAAAEEMGSTGMPVYAVQGDLTDDDNLENTYQECLKHMNGHLDILLNGAGIQYRAPAVEFPHDRWKKILDVNLTSMFFMSQLAGKTMIEQKHGKIINVASMCSFFGSVLIPAYSASKGGVAQLTKALSNEWAKYGINVNAIAPGYMATKLTENIKTVNPVQYGDITRRIPAGRWGHPEDLQGIVVFLASDAAEYITGAVIPVDGGYLAS